MTPHATSPLTYQLRIALLDTNPPVWRRVELASELRLDALHEIIQSAFGWTDSHLHRFARGSDIWSDEGEHYLCPFEIAEGEQGTAAERVRLDDVLTNPGDELRYVYDFGDDWQHSIELEAVEPRTVGAPVPCALLGSDRARRRTAAASRVTN